MALRLRPIRSTDKAALTRFHKRLSDDTRYRRYHAAKGDLTTSDLKYLTEVDGHVHIALVAEVTPPELDGVAGPVADFVGAPEVADLAGVARIVGDPEHPGQAEVAIVVRDDAHGHGLGAELIEGVLERGRQEGVKVAVAQVQADNHRALRLFQGLGFRQRSGHGPVVELVHPLDEDLAA
ncbi:MAG: CoA-binding domain protein [Solirubrobacterales bacterium]|nr:CoA-binding domain protein [Solirubrobacterales bacterium]